MLYAYAERFVFIYIPIIEHLNATFEWEKIKYGNEMA